MNARLVAWIAAAGLLTGYLAPRLSAEEKNPQAVSKATAFLPFEFYARHRDALALSADQARELDRLAKGLREPAQKLETERATRTKALLEAMSRNPVEIEDAMARFQAVLDAENALKALQFRNGVTMRNALSADQLRQLELLAAKDGATRLSGPAALQERIQQLRAELNKRSGGEPSLLVLSQLKQIEQMTREGRAGEAKNQLEQLLKQLRQDAETTSDATAPAAQSPR